MDFVIRNGVLKEYCGTASQVVIPKGVRKIGKDAFSDHRGRTVTTLTIPEGVTEIGDRAFQQMERLTSVSLPSTLQRIGERAFLVCRLLTQVSIPDSVSVIGKDAFGNCEELEQVQLPAALTEIPEGLFKMCGSLSRVVIPEGVKTIGAWAFGWCTRLTELQLPAGLENIGENAFYECRKLKKVEVPRGCAIDPRAFTYCFGLADQSGLVILQDRLLIHYPRGDENGVLVIPDRVERIENGALTGRDVRHVEMNLCCPLWDTTGDAPILGLTRSILTASGSTVSFRDDTGRIVAKVILSVEGEAQVGQTYGRLSLRQKDHVFEFAWYDACWEKLEVTQNRLRVALVRLQYPYALPERNRKAYEAYVAAHGLAAGKLVIDGDDAALLGKLLEKKLLQKDVLFQLVDDAGKAGKITMTALLLQAIHESK